MIQKILLVLLLLLWNNSAFAENWADHANCIGVWTMDESSGNIADSCDEMGTGTAGGTGLTYSGTGQFGTAIGFDGDSGYFDFGDIDDFNGISSLTSVLWMDIDGTHFISVLRKDGTCTPVQFDDTTPDTYRFACWDSSGSLKRVRIDEDLFTPGTGYAHYAVSWNKDTNSGYATLYIDGVSKGLMNDGDALTTTIYTGGSNPFRIGATESDGENYEGLLDEVGLFEAALDSTDINDIMDNGLVQGGNILNDFKGSIYFKS